MRQRINAGGGGDVWRQPGAQRRVQRRHFGHHAWVNNHQLALALGVGNDGGHRHFAARAGRGGHSVNGNRCVQTLEVTGQAAQGFAGVGDGHRNGFGGIHGRPASHGHDGVAAVFLVKIDAALDQRNGRIGRDLVKHHVLRTACRERVGQVLQQAQLGNHPVGDDEKLRVAKACHRLAQAAAGARSNQQCGLWNGHEAQQFACTLHHGAQAEGARGRGDEIKVHGFTPWRATRQFAVSGFIMGAGPCLYGRDIPAV